MPEIIKIACPHCSGLLGVKAVHIGKLAKCPRCKQQFQAISPQLVVGRERRGNNSTARNANRKKTASATEWRCPNCERVFSRPFNGEFCDDCIQSRPSEELSASTSRSSEPQVLLDSSQYVELREPTVIKRTRSRKAIWYGLALGIIPLLVVVVFLFSAPVSNDVAETRQELRASEVFQATLPSTILIISDDSLGTGFVVDADRRLAVTNAHVVGLNREVTVVFPKWSDSGELLTRLEDYVGAGIEGTVVHTSRRQDLAIIQLPEETPVDSALSLAGSPAQPGDSVFTVANPGDYLEDTLWVFGTGTVNAVVNDWEGQFDNQTVIADAILMEMGIVLPGASGGPIVNNYGELVAINQSLQFRAFTPLDKKVGISVTEIREFLSEYTID